MKSRPATRRIAGFSLIELLVSMAIGLVVTIAIAAVMVSSETNKRGATAVNDINQAGSYIAYVLDRQIRSAGSGFAQSWSSVAGCQIYAKNSTGTVLPRSFPSPTPTLPSPFAGWTAPIALAPVVIGAGLAAGTGGDLLMVMTGTGGFVEGPPSVLPGVTTSTIRLNNTVGFRTGDLVLIADAPAVPGKCLLQQVGTFAGGGSNGSIDQALPLGGDYAGGVSGGPLITSFGPTSNAVLAQLGNFNGDLPQFSMLGVGPNNSLVSTDLLPAGAPDDTGNNQVIADSVVQMNALYGTVPYPSSAGVTPPVRWVRPVAGSGYTPADLLPSPSTATSQKLLRGIVAIRIGLVLRSAIGEQKAVSGIPPILFGSLKDASLRVNGPALATSPPYYRYRTVELTIPLRNVMMAP